MQQLVRARAEIRYVSSGQPVTFGFRRPVVLLPEILRTQSADIRRVVLCHELFHVRRHDWVWVVAEEVVRAVFWFHPAVLWLISRVRLAREEVVDELTVLATSERRAYMEALLVFADGRAQAPAAAFARRRHLFRRMVLISKEAVMSSRQVVLSSAAMAVIVAVASWYAVSTFPLTQVVAAQGRTGGPAAAAVASEAGPLERQAKPITPENPIPRRTFSVDSSEPQRNASDVVDRGGAGCDRPAGPRRRSAKRGSADGRDSLAAGQTGCDGRAEVIHRQAILCQRSDGRGPAVAVRPARRRADSLRRVFHVCARREEASAVARRSHIACQRADAIWRSAAPAFAPTASASAAPRPGSRGQSVSVEASRYRRS